MNTKNVIIEKPNLRYEGKDLKIGDEIKMEAWRAQEWTRAGMAKIVNGKSGPSKVGRPKKEKPEKAINGKPHETPEDEQSELSEVEIQLKALDVYNLELLVEQNLKTLQHLALRHGIVAPRKAGKQELIDLLMDAKASEGPPKESEDEQED